MMATMWTMMVAPRLAKLNLSTGHVPSQVNSAHLYVVMEEELGMNSVMTVTQIVEMDVANNVLLRLDIVAPRLILSHPTFAA